MKMDKLEYSVGIYKQKTRGYSERPPYFPPAIFEEYPFKDSRTDKRNQAYASLRELFILLGLDTGNFGSRNWNPLGSFISPGDTVLLKPNFMHHRKEGGGSSGLITHGSIIRTVADYAYIATKGSGRIIIADGPTEGADFRKIVKIAGLERIRDFYRDNTGFDIEIYDLRQEMVLRKQGRIIKSVKLEGDPLGYTRVDLGKASEFEIPCMDYKCFRGPDSNKDEVAAHHDKTRHEYLISNTLLNADVVINIPKLKTHRRAGVTLSLKNMIGVTGGRTWLPHFSEETNDAKESHVLCARAGNASLKELAVNIIKSVYRFGDRHFRCVVRPLRRMVKPSQYVPREGAWHGNDVIWRTIADLWKIASYADKKGVIMKEKQRRTFVIIDGIIGGENNGPSDPDPKQSGVLIGGFNGFCVDIAAARIMGFDPLKIPKFRKISGASLSMFCQCDLSKINCRSNEKEWDKDLGDINGSCLDFEPHAGWKNFIEADENKQLYTETLSQCKVVTRR